MGLSRRVSHMIRGFGVRLSNSPDKLPTLALVLGLATMAACGGGDSQSPGNQEEPATVGCKDGSLAATGALYRVCFPASWNGDLVVYAHGYVAADAIGRASCRERV